MLGRVDLREANVRLHELPISVQGSQEVCSGVRKAMLIAKNLADLITRSRICRVICKFLLKLFESVPIRFRARTLKSDKASDTVMDSRKLGIDLERLTIFLDRLRIIPLCFQSLPGKLVDARRLRMLLQ